MPGLMRSHYIKGYRLDLLNLSIVIIIKLTSFKGSSIPKIYTFYILSFENKFSISEILSTKSLSSVLCLKI